MVLPSGAVAVREDDVYFVSAGEEEAEAAVAAAAWEADADPRTAPFWSAFSRAVRVFFQQGHRQKVCFPSGKE